MNSVVHFEIPADDVKRANKFYSEVFGWKMNPVAEMDYTIVTTTAVGKDMMPKKPGAINGGLMKRTKTAKTPVIVISVKSLDKHLKVIKKHGGKVVMPKQQVGDMGLYARVTDTEGNVIGVWQNLK